SPQRAWQGDTAVDPAHRNRGIGRWLKAAMLLHVMDERPELRRIETENAGSNDAMLGINVALGFEVLQWQAEWQVNLPVLAAAVRDRLGVSA
ncbi:MAG: hypothetical protein QOG64_1431, partial [Acidimicrobiaceae bacterium]|nr:hypothetical protein [Acidimicrobiaceae bacterium]